MLEAHVMVEYILTISLMYNQTFRAWAELNIVLALLYLPYTTGDGYNLLKAVIPDLIIQAIWIEIMVAFVWVTKSVTVTVTYAER